MYESEVTALAPDGLTFMRTVQVEMEKCLIITRKVIPRPGGEFLIVLAASRDIWLVNASRSDSGDTW
jgi:hypothetical protein